MGPSAPSVRRRQPIGWRGLLLLGEAVVAVALASLSVRLLPFRRVVADRAPRPVRAAATIDLRRLRWAVDAAARRVPWRAVCFQRAVALRAMLRRRGIASVLHYGIAHEGPDRLKAHVWLSVAGQVVIGGEAAARFACVGSFPDGDV
ncbi:lasso peptide biosynthesis B2 protein [Sphingomonas parva]|uniref:Lasso peptide biosynthesis B2 protein n=1 Tax=Sphingomonas parva TaxID=2555898 RepID=A0A4Y8ZMK5_9SPHN|nr:lasso peptide biosynthesis B2 protein [Sphingomonas parva]TFI57220.1 lasso peptide biosynthesis B2 protein [Sphingomonas parva]